MEPHELAIAALNEVARNTSYRERAESGSITNEGCHSYAGIHSKLPNSPENDAILLQSSRGVENQGCSRAGRQNADNNISTIEECSRLSTPPTSNSDTVLLQKGSSHGPKSYLSQLSNIAASQEPLNHALATPLTGGQKRTADGYVKSESPASSVSVSCHKHSRRASALSNGSNTSSAKIEELSSELRTRLSYAMIKVNNGWQSNSIDELESLASQKGSPTSSSSIVHGRRYINQSPRVAMARIKGHQGSNSFTTLAGSPEFDSFYRLDQQSRTYESFWRDHSVAENLNNRYSPNGQARSLPASRALAPPAEICRSFPRGTGSPKNNSSKARMITSSYGSMSPNPNLGPQTPQRDKLQQSGITMNSSSQTTQEQDAIETLLFMSSPGNLKNMGRILPPPKTFASPQKSPLRSELYMMPTRTAAIGKLVKSDMGFRRCEKVNNQSTTEVLDQPSRPNSSKNPCSFSSQDECSRDSNIERLLDEMGDSSSDEDEFLSKHHASAATKSTSTSHHQVATGQA